MIQKNVTHRLMRHRNFPKMIKLFLSLTHNCIFVENILDIFFIGLHCNAGLEIRARVDSWKSLMFTEDREIM